MGAPGSEAGHVLGIDEGQGNTIVAYKLPCICSYRVRCEVTRYGEQLGGLIFFDDEEASVTQGEQVLHCPGCQSLLGLSRLRF